MNLQRGCDRIGVMGKVYTEEQFREWGERGGKSHNNHTTNKTKLKKDPDYFKKWHLKMLRKRQLKKERNRNHQSTLSNTP